MIHAFDVYTDCLMATSANGRSHDPGAMRPVGPTLRVLEQIRADADPVVFLADRRLPEEHLRTVLAEAGMLRASDELLMTSNSPSPAMALLNLKAERNLPDGEVVFHGQVDRRTRSALRRHHVLVADPVDTSPTRYEQAVEGHAGLPMELRHRIAGSYRAARLETSPDSTGWLPDVVPIAAGAIGPLFVAFVAWTLERARHKGIRRLYFVARDGQVLFRIAQELVSGPEDPELVYLYGSRQAWYLPSVERIDRGDLHFLVDEANSLAIRDNLLKVHLRPETISAELSRHGFDPTTWDDQLGSAGIERFWDVLAEPRVAELIFERRDRARRIVLEYFGQEGLLEDEQWAIVDIGWNLTAQRALHRILTSGGQPYTFGYYLALGHNRTTASEHGGAEGLLVEERDYGPRYPGRASIFENKGLIDQVFTIADHGRTIGYERSSEKSVAVLVAEREDPQRYALFNTVRRTVESLAREIARSDLARLHVPELIQAGRLGIETFLRHPTRAEARAIQWFPIVYDHNDVDVRTVPLASRIGVRTFAQIVATVLRRLASGGRVTSAPFTTPTAITRDLSWGFSWLEGAAALSSPPVKLAVRIFRLLNRALARRGRR